MIYFTRVRTSLDFQSVSSYIEENKYFLGLENATEIQQALDNYFSIAGEN